MAESIRGNKTLSGTWGELWIDGEKIFEFSKIERPTVKKSRSALMWTLRLPD